MGRAVEEVRATKIVDAQGICSVGSASVERLDDGASVASRDAARES